MTRRAIILWILSLVGASGTGALLERHSRCLRLLPIRTSCGDGSEQHPFEDLLAHGPLDTVNSNQIYARQQVADDLNRIFPGTFGCGRCRFPWQLVRYHITDLGGGRGIFVLCEDCWKELQVADWRMPYYRAIFNPVSGWPEKDWPLVMKSVQAEEKAG